MSAQPTRKDAVLRTSSRHPSHIFMLVLCTIAGLPTLLQVAPVPGTIEATLPPWMVLGWSAMLALGGTTAIVGVLMGSRLLGVIVEQIGLVAIGVAATVYTFCIFVVARLPGLVPGTLVATLAATCFLDWWALQKEVRRITAVVGHLREE